MRLAFLTALIPVAKPDTGFEIANGGILDALRAAGHEGLVSRAVTVLSAPAVDVDAKLRARLYHHFGQLTRVVLDVPHDPALVPGGPLLIETLQDGTREAWLQVTAAVADGL